MPGPPRRASFIPRALEPVLRKAAREFPVVILTGPRQSGKTTLLAHVFGTRHEYVSLETPDMQLAAATDPRGFLALHPPPVILDEIQNATGLLPYIKDAVDRRRDRRGQYLLTGSQSLLLLESVSESLAGRAAMLRLLPLSIREIQGQSRRRLPWEVPHLARKRKPGQARALFELLIRGSYPEVVRDPARDASLWLSSYVQTYLERDVRQLRQIGHLTQFQLFLRALAARSGQLLNLSDVGRDLGLATNTVKSWLAILEATFQIVVLRPYFANIGKRLVKLPKVYFTDTGVLCHLTGLKEPDHAASGPLAGAILETAVVGELLKTLHGRGEAPHLYFWRTSTGIEVDVVVEQARNIIPIEVKLSSSPTPHMAASIIRMRGDLGDRVGPGYVVHSGDVRLPLAPGVQALGLLDL